MSLAHPRTTCTARASAPATVAVGRWRTYGHKVGIRFGLLLAAFCPWVCQPVERLASAHDRPAVLAAEAGFVMRGFGVEDGLPQAHVRAVAQTPDGYLWVATEGGLARFDGVRFTVFDVFSNPKLPTNDVKALAVDRDGTLWVGVADGALRRGTNERTFTSIASHTRKTGDSDVNAIFVDSRNNTWLGGFRGHTLFSGGSFQVFPRERSGIATSVSAIAEGPDGVMWLGGGEGLARLRGDQMTMFPTGAEGLPADRITALAFAEDGTLWIGTANKGLVKRVGDRFSPLDGDGLPAPAAVTALLIDPSGRIWAGGDSGLFHIQRESLKPVYDQGRPLGAVTALARDREGSIWVGIRGRGLLRITEPRLETIYAQNEEPATRPTVVHVDRRGDIWVGTRDAGLRRLDARGVQRIDTNSGLCVDAVRALTDTADGALWVGGSGGVQGNLCRVASDGNISTFGQSAGLPADGTVTGFFEAPPGRLWVIAGSVHGFDGKRFDSTGPPVKVASLWGDGRGRLFAGAAGSIFQHDPQDRGGVWHRLEERPPLAYAYQVAPSGVWVGSESGLLRFDGRRTVRVLPASPLQGVPVLGIESDRLRNLWLCTPRGVLRVSQAALDMAGPPAIARLGARHGLGGDQCAFNPSGARAAGPDGRLLFLATDRVVAVDPKRFDVETKPPEVIIEEIVADGHLFPPGGEGPVRIPAGRRDLRISYTANHLAIPEDINFRYRIDGLNEDWYAAGTDRSAHFVNLPPGKHLFRVTARNQNGPWHPQGAAVALDLEPYFHETAIFRLLMAALFALAIVLGHRWRLRILRSRHDAIVVERTRVARDLHDTVAQGLAAVQLRLDTLKRTSPTLPAEARSRIEDVRTLALGTLAEARALLTELRADKVERAHADVLEHLAAAARRLALGGPTEIHVAPIPTAMPALADDTRRALLRIGQEAVANALRHASARTISLALAFDATAVELRITDDGRGMSAAGPAADAYGLAGMAERATHMGGEVRIESEPGRGTVVIARLPIVGAG